MRTEPFAPHERTQDDFLGGRARLFQPKTGYRAGIDPVLLAAAVSTRPGQTVLELGCGHGAALICLGTRIGGLHLTGIEIQPAYAALARDNLRANGLDGTITCANLTQLPADLKQQSFDHVIANPPYFLAGTRTPAHDPAREIGLAGETPLSDWIATAARRLKPGGHAVFIQTPKRLPELLTHMSNCLGSLQLMPIVSRPGRGPKLVLVRGRKGGRAAFRFHPALVLHLDRGDPPTHGKDYTATAKAILSDAAALDFPT